MFIYTLRCKHSSFNRIMRPFDLRHIKEPSRVPCKHPSGESEFRYCVIAALIQASRPIRKALTSLQHLCNFWMRFVLLEHFIWVDIWVLIVETDHKADMYEVWRHMVHERTSIDVTWQRPVDCVLDLACLEIRISFSHSPHLFQTDTVMLEAHVVFIKLELALYSLG